MLPFLLWMFFSPDAVQLHCRAEGADRLQTHEFTLFESERKVQYPDASGIIRVDATFGASEIGFPDSWPKPVEGAFSIDRKALTFRRVVTYKDSVVLDERGRCSIYIAPPSPPDDGRGERPPAG
ncbi:hypothetical protein [Sphingopyxis sp.]|jgi:hypothetical protein|uniref:hypothetical protein n=1 Tax=Sphingopyxis sp. TaxID=1908224 RepID=UPI002DF84444|nr:hypothetical protein [Sphingopyxis sp.]